VARAHVTWPRLDVRSAFRRVFGAASDDDLGFYDQRSESTAGARLSDDDVDRDLIELATRAGTGTLDLRDLAPAAAAVLTTVGRNQVLELHELVDDFERADHKRGGGSPTSRDLIARQVRESLQTLKDGSFASADIRQDWQLATSRAARLAGFSHFDAGDHSTANRAFLLSLALATDAEDWAARMHAIGGMARQAIWVGQPEKALHLVNFARAGEERVSATTRTMLSAIRARAYAALGRDRDCLRAVEEAHDAFGDRLQDTDPAFLWFYDEAQLAGDTGHAVFDLAMARDEHAGLAEDLLATAVRRHNRADTRALAFSQCRLVAVRLRWNTVLTHEAVEGARYAGQLVAGLRSERAASDLRRVTDLLADRDDAAAHALADELDAGQVA